MNGASPVNLLVIDDDEDFAESIAALLRMHGHRVEIEATGEAGVARFAAGDIDLVLLDVRLPGIDGLDALARLRARHTRAPVIMITGYGRDSVIREAQARGALAVLEKPLDPERVFELVADAATRAVVMIADDDPDFAAALGEALRGAGFRTRIASDGHDTVTQIAREVPAALLLDLRMPRLDGAAVCQRIEELGITVPTLIVTGYARDEADTISRLLSGPVADMFEKPFPTELLLDAVRTMVATH